ncbi:hatching enzyme 1.2-like isoform X2 [Portunus trituberculatus]|uniref:hatching enzyme 1.2-like isoform X2 n=2 Tax=Portunus trituberculatus TaxID=210409 RepID=UPI001E1CB841|nr:hatching enzyme 1.2-like isoform X2 [Portunus trituberculatus]
MRLLHIIIIISIVSGRRRRRMGRRAVTAAAVTVAWCAATVMCRVLLTDSPLARTPRDAHTWHTNSLSRGREDRQGGERGGHLAGQQADNTPDDVYGSVGKVDTERTLLREWIEDPEVTPGLFQGDMMISSPDLLPMSTRVAVNWDKFPERRWGNATVPYVISKLYGTSERKMIMLALHSLDFLTCIKFVPWDEVTKDYLLIWPMERPKGCWSFVGKRGGQQVVSLQAPDEYSKRCFISLGKVIHELLHALGMFHEQSRPDRDEHIDIITENIIPDYIGNFRKQSADNTTFPFRYDYNSVMHYGSNFFSFNLNKPTIVPKVKGAKIGQRIMMSKLDCLKLNELYGCLDNPFNKEKYTALCTYLGY